MSRIRFSRRDFVPVFTIEIDSQGKCIKDYPIIIGADIC